MRLAVTGLAGALLVAGCGSSSPSADAGPVPSELTCPLPGGLPFEVDSSWNNDYSGERIRLQPRIKHQPIDLLGNPTVGYAQTDFEPGAALLAGDEELHGVVARIETDRGFFVDPIPEETVSLWEYRDGDGWIGLGETTSAGWGDAVPGAYAFALGAPLPSAEVTIRYAVLNGEPSCGRHYTYDLPAGRQVVIADIDGTLTVSDDELIMQVSDGSYDPVQMTASAEMLQAWAAKGYRIVYLTARPHLFRAETREWLERHDYPDGALITANELVSGESARAHKVAWLDRVIGELEWRVTAAYGNAASDIDAYADAGIAKETTFIVGELAGDAGTVAIENGDFTSHIADYVEQQPDADQL